MLGAAITLIVVSIPLSAPQADDDGEASLVAAETIDRPRTLTLRGFDPEPTRRLAMEVTDGAIAAAAHSSLGRRHLPDIRGDYRDILGGTTLTDGSLSLGTIREGSLKNAAALPLEGDHHEVIERHRSRNTNYGTEELVNAIERAARKVREEHGGAPLRIGNIGYARGGAIPWSRSHRAGRDADIAFYAVDEQGRSVPTPDLFTFDDEGVGEKDDLYFDIPRNWSLVRALLTDPDIVVQWMFVSTGLKILLIDHAIEIDEDPEIIERAINVLHQPTDALPHDGHLHLRIACTEADRLAGCVDWGPQWQWHDWHEPALFARTRQMQRAFADPSPQLRAQAMEYLHEIRSPFAPEVALQYGLTDPDPDVRELAFELLGDIAIGSDAGIFLLARALDSELDDDERRTLYGSLRRAQSPRASDLAMERYRDGELDEDERALAVRALAQRTDSSLLPQLIDALQSEPSSKLRERLAAQLYRIAARTDGIDWGEEELTEEHEVALQQWRQWWEEDEPERQQILEEFVLQRGAEEWKDLHAVDDLIAQLRGAEDWEIYNLNRIISAWTGRWAPQYWANDGDAHRFWTRWWNRNQDRLLNARPKPWDDWEAH